MMIPFSHCIQERITERIRRAIAFAKDPANRPADRPLCDAVGCYYLDPDNKRWIAVNGTRVIAWNHRTEEGVKRAVQNEVLVPFPMPDNLKERTK